MFQVFFHAGDDGIGFKVIGSRFKVNKGLIPILRAFNDLDCCKMTEAYHVSSIFHAGDNGIGFKVIGKRVKVNKGHFYPFLRVLNVLERLECCKMFQGHWVKVQGQ